jgi:hypothetical protein
MTTPSVPQDQDTGLPGDLTQVLIEAVAGAIDEVRLQGVTEDEISDEEIIGLLKDQIAADLTGES